MSFQHSFNYSEEETTYFAFTYPFSYQESQEKIDDIENKVSSGEIPNCYFHREVLYHSLEGRKMEIFTLTSNDGITNERED